MKKIHTEKAPATIGPYSQGMVVGNLVYTSGQIPIDPATGNIVGDNIEAQTERVCLNMKEVLLAGGADFDSVVKTTCFLADMADFAAFNAVYAKYFVGKPARSCVAVRELPKNVLVEIDTIAEI